MSIYAIGDVQGGYQPLLRLLNEIQFDAERDTLWFTGNLVNRGPDSLEVLRFVKNLGQRAKIVLGDEELHLLAAAEGVAQLKPDDTFDEVLNAPDRNELMAWLRQRPLLHHDATLNFLLVHAGLPAEWSLSQARTFAIEVESSLSFGNHKAFLENFSVGNPPRRWNAKLQGWKRLQFISNTLTRIRFSDEKGYLDFTFEGSEESHPDGYLPWYQIPDRQTANVNIVFSHWAATNETVPRIFPLTKSTNEVPPKAIKLPNT